MIKKLGNYRFAFYLASAVAAIELTIFLYLTSVSFDAANRSAGRAAIALLIVFGIWVQSKIARYVGAIWLLISAAFVFWPMFTSDRFVVSIASILFPVVGVLSLATSLIMLFSTTFSNEFSYNRQTQAKYKNVLRQVAFVAIIAAMVVATLNDIYNIALRAQR